MSVEANNIQNNMCGTYVIRINCTLIENKAKAASNITFLIDTQNLYAPVFLKALDSNITTQVKNVTKYYWPLIYDGDGDTTLIKIGLADSQIAPSFMKSTKYYLQIAPTRNKDEGQYTVNVLLADTNPRPLFTGYQITVIITPYLPPFVNINKTEVFVPGKMQAFISDISADGLLTIKFFERMALIQNLSTLFQNKSLNLSINQKIISKTNKPMI